MRFSPRGRTDFGLATLATPSAAQDRLSLDAARA
jgi:hypothetical protein